MWLRVLLWLAVPRVSAIDDCYRERYPTSQVTVKWDVVYGTAYSTRYQTPKELTMDVYSPVNYHEELRPLVIFIHGGNCSYGSKGSSEFVAWSESFARRGFVAANIDYRTESYLPQCRTYGSIEAAGSDAKAAVRHFQAYSAEYMIDPNRIVFVGASAGARIAMWASYAEGNGLGATHSSNNPEQSGNVQGCISISGELYAPNQGTPIISFGDPALMLVHGVYDEVFYLDAANTAFEAALAANVPTEQLFLPGGHMPWESIEENMNYLYYFISKNLQLPCFQPRSCDSGTPCAPGYWVYCVFGPAANGCRPGSAGLFSMWDCYEQCQQVE